MQIITVNKTQELTLLIKLRDIKVKVLIQGNGILIYLTLNILTGCKGVVGEDLEEGNEVKPHTDARKTSMRVM